VDGGGGVYSEPRNRPVLVFVSFNESAIRTAWCQGRNTAGISIVPRKRSRFNLVVALRFWIIARIGERSREVVSPSTLMFHTERDERFGNTANVPHGGDSVCVTVGVFFVIIGRTSNEPFPRYSPGR